MDKNYEFVDNEYAKVSFVDSKAIQLTPRSHSRIPKKYSSWLMEQKKNVSVAEETKDKEKQLSEEQIAAQNEEKMRFIDRTAYQTEQKNYNISEKPIKIKNQMFSKIIAKYENAIEQKKNASIEQPKLEKQNEVEEKTVEISKDVREEVVEKPLIVTDFARLTEPELSEKKAEQDTIEQSITNNVDMGDVNQRVRQLPSTNHIKTEKFETMTPTINTIDDKFVERLKEALENAVNKNNNELQASQQPEMDKENTLQADTPTMSSKADSQDDRFREFLRVQKEKEEASKETEKLRREQEEAKKNEEQARQEREKVERQKQATIVKFVEATKKAQELVEKNKKAQDELKAEIEKSKARAAEEAEKAKRELEESKKIEAMIEAMSNAQEEQEENHKMVA